MCGNSNTWAYINKGNDNYAAYVATLLAAKATGAEIRLYTDRDQAPVTARSDISPQPHRELAPFGERVRLHKSSSAGHSKLKKERQP